VVETTADHAHGRRRIVVVVVVVELMPSDLSDTALHVVSNNRYVQLLKALTGGPTDHKQTNSNYAFKFVTVVCACLMLPLSDALHIRKRAYAGKINYNYLKYNLKR